MTNDPSNPVATKYSIPCDHPFYLALCWKAILAGTVATIGIHMLLFTLGVAGGLTIFTPITDADPVAHFSAGAAIIWSLCAIISLLVGGLIAGRFSNSPHSGFTHGLLVWSLCLIIAVVLLASGAGAVASGIAKVLGGATNVIGNNLSTIVAENSGQLKDELKSFADEAVSPDLHDSDSIAKKRELTAAIKKIFTPSNDVATKEDRAAIVASLNGVVKDPEQVVNRWTAYHENLKKELAAAEQKAREAADRAAHNLACVSIWLFFALLVGMLVAALGGRCGAKCALRHVDEQFLNVS